MNKTNKAEIGRLKLQVKYLSARYNMLLAVVRNIYSEKYPDKTPDEIEDLWNDIIEATSEEISEDKAKLKSLTT